MSASVSRRFLFTGAVGGASSILFLSACSSGASVVAAERTDYSGEVTFGSFRREGEYTAPTRTEPAKNAPVPRFHTTLMSTQWRAYIPPLVL